MVGSALLADTVPQEILATATGYVGAGMSVGILLGPLLGGSCLIGRGMGRWLG